MQLRRAERPALSRFEGEPQRRIDAPYPGGESYRDVVARLRSFLADLPLELEGRRIVVIGHAATRWALEHLLVGTPLDELVGSPFRWQEGWEYVLVRDERHLYVDGGDRSRPGGS